MFSFHHVALSVRELGPSIAFYEIFGFEPVFRWQSDDGELSIVHLKQGEVLLELFRFRTPVDAPHTSHELSTDLPRIGMKHFGLKSEDIDIAAAHLMKLGLVEHIEIVEGRTGIRYFFVKDPSGLMVEVVEDNRKL
ncbi:glyoxylase I family protein [Mariprofundus ferrinatatus]|uniref:Glyoxylase I family protein n=1 Tax=Mariprofundus ferrinatatus TaxID=1921087 RepID=A0A2K8LBQ4_9PROT|nr:VOC family protein [Mariprofundus ferrinatatus]ATX81676.1 glyoxylase I family protein [Mariprofundus ferrinatatus]